MGVIKNMYIYHDYEIQHHLDSMLELMSLDMPYASFRALFKRVEEGCAFNVTSNQYKRIKHFLMTLSLKRPELWNNPLYVALCMGEFKSQELKEADSEEYLSEVDVFYSTVTPIKYQQSIKIPFDEMRLFEPDTNHVVIGECHGTMAPITLLSSAIPELQRAHAAVLIEGFSLEEIEEINCCNHASVCSALLYMLIPVEKSLQYESVALEKRQLIASLVSAGIKIIPGDNKHGVNLGATTERLRLFNYSALHNALAAGHEGPIVFLVGKAHAITTEDCPGIGPLIGAKVFDLTGELPSVHIPLSPINEKTDGIIANRNLFFTPRLLSVETTAPGACESTSLTPIGGISRL